MMLEDQLWLTVGRVHRPVSRRTKRLAAKAHQPSTRERIRDNYGVNYPWLAQINARYDPANQFRSNQNILPAAPPSEATRLEDQARELLLKVGGVASRLETAELLATRTRNCDRARRHAPTGVRL